MTLKQKFRCRHQRCCLTSKAAVLILLWNLILVAGLKCFFDPSFYDVTVEYFDVKGITILSGSMYSVIAFLFLFYPLAGYLADIRWGRYKTVVNSLCVIWGSLVAILVLPGMALASVMITGLLSKKRFQDSVSYQIQVFVTVGVVFALPLFIALLLVPCGLIFFSANVIQYGIDQLHDAPMEDSILYIHWYVWTSYAGLLPMKFAPSIFGDISLAFSPCFILLPIVFLGVTLCIQRYKHHWFLID